MRCDQCRHWKNVDTRDWEAERAGFGECLGVRERWRITEDSMVGQTVYSDLEWEAMSPEERMDSKMEERSAALKAARAYVQDGSEYRAELYTAPDFFCALFAARDSDTHRMAETPEEAARGEA